MSNNDLPIEEKNPKISVLISLYAGDQPEHVDTAFESIFWQTRQPDEVVVVTDGPIGTTLTETVEEWERKHPEIITIVSLSENQGLGRALQAGLQKCSYELVARMDADDIAVPERFEKQVDFMTSNPDIDVLGGYIAEFADDPSEIETVRSVPTDPAEIATHASYRNPLNHPTVMFRKSTVLAVGGYDDWKSMQDYELWMRLLNSGYTLANIPDVLVKARAGAGLYDRRGGLGYAMTEYHIQHRFLKNGHIRPARFVLNLILRIPIRIAPKFVRKFVYTTLLRKNKTGV
ncbi:glycosyltransferase [Natronococcus sp.]|uniref:glycosyltransferase n=1 Tax=Natronococcus sp. TaxID=35747 RepID=UPI003A4E11CE